MVHVKDIVIATLERKVSRTVGRTQNLESLQQCNNAMATLCEVGHGPLATTSDAVFGSGGEAFRPGAMVQTNYVSGASHESLLCDDRAAVDQSAVMQATDFAPYANKGQLKRWASDPADQDKENTKTKKRRLSVVATGVLAEKQNQGNMLY